MRLLLKQFNHIHAYIMIIINDSNFQWNDYSNICANMMSMLTQIYCKMDHVVHECIDISAPDLHDKSEHES